MGVEAGCRVVASVAAVLTLVHIGAGGELGEGVPVAGVASPAGTVTPARLVHTLGVTRALVN